MKIQLQQFAHQHSSYARPNQPWVCGKKTHGYCCEAGPDKEGHCRTEFECHPYREKESWVCTRSQLFGGLCVDGPLPTGHCCKKITQCQPYRSIKNKRNALVKWSIYFAFAFFLFILSSASKEHFFNPGELTLKHASIDQCKACHQVFDKNPLTWIKQAFSNHNTIHNSQQCLDCHPFGKAAHFPHSLLPEQLEKLTQNQNPLFYKDNKQLACVSCHLEHHGSEFDLTAVAKQNCAYCHQLNQSFINTQHTEFKHYPYQRETRIIFDHITHEKKYYYNKTGNQRLKAAPKTCVSCHKNDKSGVKMHSGSYENDCKACHNEVFEESESFIVFDIPRLSLNTSQLKNLWPEDANGALTHYMILLLSTDPIFIEATAGLDEYYDLTELDEIKTLKLIKAIKNLFYDINSQGSLAFKQRLKTTFNCQWGQPESTVNNQSCQIKEDDLDHLIKVIPVHLFCQIQKHWFPNLISQDGHCRKSLDKSKEKSQLGEWTLNEFSIEYRPVTHKDVFFKTWLNLTRHPINQPLAEKTRKKLFSELSSENASVQCTLCHSVEKSGANHFTINWPGEYSLSEKREFIKFKHDIHIKYQEDEVCATCHIENKQTGYLAAYEDKNPLTFVSNFRTDREVCSSCHLKSMTEEQCQLCHNYHISP